MAGTSAAKKKILSSIRENLAASRAFESHNVHATPVAVPTLSKDSATDPVDRFGTELEGLGVTCFLAEDRNQAKEALAEVLREANITKIAVSDDSLTDLLVDSGVEIALDAPKDYLFGVDAGITGARWAIAETGTLVLCSSSERNRLASLVPPIHICVLNAQDIRQTMGEILQMIDTKTDAAVTFVTGASRTSDIELTLAIGVHGPKRLIVIVIAE